jgi:hypothetical protein
MRLFEAIRDANQRSLAGDAEAALHPADYALAGAGLAPSA